MELNPLAILLGGRMAEAKMPNRMHPFGKDMAQVALDELGPPQGLGLFAVPIVSVLPGEGHGYLGRLMTPGGSSVPVTADISRRRMDA